MRIIHARKRVWKRDLAFQNKFTLLVWILSIVKWKEYGHKVILYCDKETLNEIKKFGFDVLYDEINTELFENNDNYKDIDFYYYWAMPKIISLYYETYHLGNNALVADQDVVPMQDLTYLTKRADCLVWSNKEYVELRNIYPRVEELSLPKNYELPQWFSGYARPLNTGVIYFKNKQHVIEYCNEVFKYVKGNNNERKNTRCIAMCNAEQRMLGEYLVYKDLTYCTVQPNNEGLFNDRAFHMHGYKNYINNDNGLLWQANLLKLIEKSNRAMYTKLINNEWFKEEKEHMSKYNLVDELKQYM